MLAAIHSERLEARCATGRAISAAPRKSSGDHRDDDRAARRHNQLPPVNN
jgi:hypothetical protein